MLHNLSIFFGTLISVVRIVPIFLINIVNVSISYTVYYGTSDKESEHDTLCQNIFEKFSMDR